MIFSYDNYKAFLKAWIRTRPRKGRGEIKEIAKCLKVSSTLISAILNGTRQLSIEQACEVAEYCGLKKLQADYFIALVSFERAGSQKLKAHLVEQIKDIKLQSEKIEKRLNFEKSLSVENSTIYYSNPIYSMVRILSTLENGVSLQEINEVVKLSSSKVQSVLEFLQKSGLILQKDNRYFASERSVHVQKDSQFYLQHHKNWRIQQLTQVTETKEDDVIYTCPCTIDSESFQKIRKMLLKVIEDSHEIMRTAPAQEVACLTIDFISYSKKP